MTLRRAVVLALDGTPHSYLRALLAAGVMPHFARLVEGGSLRRMESVFPTVSSCAWASFMTGMDPGGHNIYGFVDRRPESWEIYIPTARNRTGEAIWERLTRLGKRVCVMNVPGTYPARPVNGTLISGFLSPNVDKVCADPAVVAELKSLDYRVDVDGWQGRSDPKALLGDVEEVLAAKERALFHFLRKERWDFFMAHVMSVDRMQHFLWRQQEDGDPLWQPAFLDVYRKVDGIIGRVADEVGDDAELVILSDHGFCTIKREVQVNRWLQEQGYLVLRDDPEPRDFLKNVDVAATRAYSLIPGRIFVNLKGRESGGVVTPGEEYERLRREIAERLLDLRDPDDGARVIDVVLKREETYRGEAFHRAADLIAHPCDGYDLKGTIVTDRLWQNTALTGMHTHGDAFLFVAGSDTPQGDRLTIMDAHDVVLRAMGLA